MRIVTWNMARAIPPAAGGDSPWRVLASLEPDIALLQECRPPEDGDLGGHLHHMPTRYGWGTAVWSRSELTDCAAFPPVVASDWSEYREALDGYVASACVDVPAVGKLTIVSVHAYPAKVPEALLTGFDREALRLPHNKHVWPGDLVWWALRDHVSSLAPAIVAGDWNTARLFDKVYGNRGNHEFFERMAKADWVEYARRFHTEEVQTYFKEGKGPYQLDHAFVTDDLTSERDAFEVASSAEVLAVSDHAALVMDLAVAD